MDRISQLLCRSRLRVIERAPMIERLVDLIPPRLAIVNIHPDHIQTCIDLCCTGSSKVCHLPPGTIALVRQTSGAGTAIKASKLHRYGVVGVWAFSGRTEPVARRDRLWPSRWDNKVVFSPLVRRLQDPWCEDFSVAAEGAYHKHSSRVPGLTYIQLQGTIITIRDLTIARRYLQAFMEQRQSELQAKGIYLDEEVKVLDLLSILDHKLAELQKAEKRSPESTPNGISSRA